MKKRLLVFLLIFQACVAVAQGPWTQKASMGGVGRHRPFTFTIGMRAYLGCGWNGVDMYNDFWEYDPGTNTWQQKSDYPGGPRLSAIGFAVGNKGYAGTGLDEFLYGQGDFYSYDPATNAWTAKAYFPSTPVFAASATVVNGKGYVCFGDDWYPNYIRYNYLWEYNPVSDTWTMKTPCPGAARRDAVAFTIGNKAYFGTGNDDFYTEVGDFWEYTPATDSWVAKAFFAGSVRSQAVGFAVNGKGYIGTGGQLDEQDFFEYDPLLNSWQGVDMFPGSGRENAATFVIGNRAYVTCGTSGINFRDLWEFNPLNITGLNDQNSDFEMKIYPMPMTSASVVVLPENIRTDDLHWQMSDMNGRVLSKNEISGSEFQIQRNYLPAGNYLLTIHTSDRILTTQTLIIQ